MKKLILQKALNDQALSRPFFPASIETKAVKMVSSERVKRVRRKKGQQAAYQYQKDNRYFAQIACSLREAGAKELAELGAEDVRPDFSGIPYAA